MNGELSTQELLIVTMYQSGYSPSVIGTKLCVSPSYVRELLKTSRCVAYTLEQEESTDQLITSLYRDGAIALRTALCSANASTAPKTQVYIDKVLQVLSQPISANELQNMERYTQSDNRAISDTSEAVRTSLEDLQ
jgi:hypothetical protein